MGNRSSSEGLEMNKKMTNQNIYKIRLTKNNNMIPGDLAVAGRFFYSLNFWRLNGKSFNFN